MKARLVQFCIPGVSRALETLMTLYRLYAIGICIFIAITSGHHELTHAAENLLHKGSEHLVTIGKDLLGFGM